MIEAPQPVPLRIVISGRARPSLPREIKEIAPEADRSEEHTSELQSH